MKPIVVIFFLLQISLLAALMQADGEPAAGIQFLQSSCNKTDDYGFCMAALGVEKESYAVSDLRGLVNVTIGLIIKNGTSTLSLINELMLKNQSDKELISCLKVCQHEYNGDVYYTLPDLRELLKNKKRDNEVADTISTSAYTAMACSDAFDEGKLPVPFSKENKDYSRLGTIAQYFMNVITGR